MCFRQPSDRGSGHHAPSGLHHNHGQPKFMSHLSYTNVLYVYPQCVQFEGARNIAISIQLKDSHADCNDPGLEAIYCK